MGRWSYSGRQEADGLKQVNVSFLKKQGYFNHGWKSGTITWSRNGEKTGSISIQVFIGENEQYIELIYTQTDNQTGEKKDFDYKIPLTTTPCNYGGFRYWFICPWYANGKYCGRRIGTLYHGGDYLACRHCYDLTYASRKLSGIWKSAGKVISAPELDKMEEETKHQYYAGKMTRRYKQLVKKRDKFLFQLRVVATGLGS